MIFQLMYSIVWPSSCHWAEDTRQIQRLLKQLGIFRDQQLIRMDQYQEKRSFAAFETLISTQDVAYVSDAGSPGLSDPGALLVDYCRSNNIQVKCLPGPSALTTFIAGAGVLMGAFQFLGFFPRKEGDRKVCVDQLITAAGWCFF